MKNTVWWVVVAAAIVLASCASTPPEKPTQEAEKPAVAAPDAELAKAKQLREKVDAYKLGDYVPDEYAAAVADQKAGESAYGTDNASSKQSLDKAIAGYTSVIEKGGPLFLANIEKECAASKQAADDLKAPVAVKDDYAKALEVYARAQKEKKAVDLESAGRDFAQARDMFDAAAAQARDKRDKALAAQKEADQGISDSEQKASEATQTLGEEGIPITEDKPEGVEE